MDIIFIFPVVVNHIWRCFLRHIKEKSKVKWNSCLNDCSKRGFPEFEVICSHLLKFKTTP